jgi:hypothetical protein
VHLPAPPESAAGAAERTYLAVQSRRVAKLTAAEFVGAVTRFLDGCWAPVTRAFVYATSLNLTDAALQDAITEQRVRLAEAGIEFEVWDAEWLSRTLEPEPIVVDGFFGRAWVERFCGAQAAARLGARLDAGQVGAFRSKLARF